MFQFRWLKNWLKELLRIGRMLNSLKKLKVRFKVGSGCSCNKKNIVYTYILPIRIDGTIVGAFKFFGKNSLPFVKTCMLKIENQDYSIVGIDKLKEVKIMFKNSKNVAQIINRFEAALAAYIIGKVK